MAQATNIIPFPGRQVRGVELMQGVDDRIAFAQETMRTIEAGITKRRDDVVFSYIDRHRDAIEREDAGDIDLFGRALIGGHAQTRRGYVELSRYLSIRFEIAATNGGRTYLPTSRGWEGKFFRRLSLKLRKMGSEFPEARKGRRRTALPESA